VSVLKCDTLVTSTNAHDGAHLVVFDFDLLVPKEVGRNSQILLVAKELEGAMFGGT